MSRVWQFFKWLFVRWHISFTTIAFYGIAIKRFKNNPDLMMAFVEANFDYCLMGVFVELYIRRRSLYSTKATIPKQSERT